MIRLLTKIGGVLRNRFVAFVLIILSIFFFNFLFTGKMIPSSDVTGLWFYSGLFLLVFSVFFIDPYYTSPKNVIANILPMLLLLLSIKSEFSNEQVWGFTFFTLCLLLFFSVLGMVLQNNSESAESARNRVAYYLRKFVGLFGRGKYFYSTFFVYFLLEYGVSESAYTLVLFLVWGVLISINPEKLPIDFQEVKDLSSNQGFGKILSVLSKNVFLVELFTDRKDLHKFDVVEFSYSLQADGMNVQQGIVVDTYLMNDEKWVKVLQLGNRPVAKESYEQNIIYKVPSEKVGQIEKNLKVGNFVGIVSRGSDIGKIKFEYSKKVNDIQEGDLLELSVSGRRLFYQVVNGMTETERLETRNERGFIEGEAFQLGEWESNSGSFSRFGWLPSINTPIFKADTSDIQLDDISLPDFKLGVIPSTELPAVLDLDDAIRYHTAILGVTGSGKSFLARRIIDALKDNTKVICVDFTGEWEKELSKASIPSMLLNSKNLNTFLNGSAGAVGIIELPSLGNTVAIIAATEGVFSAIFNFAKEKYDEGNPAKICLVLEEAHTIVPEAHFLGVNNFDSKALVNRIGQVALQGRKYGVGLLVIAQRTANVSKTVLTQCNTVISFQAFDETSFSFLSNYFGSQLVKNLPNLKLYHGVVVGKALRSKIPMIVDFSQ